MKKRSSSELRKALDNLIVSNGAHCRLCLSVNDLVDRAGWHLAIDVMSNQVESKASRQINRPSTECKMLKAGRYLHASVDCQSKGIRLISDDLGLS